MTIRRALALSALSWLALPLTALAQPPTFLAFESGQVRPLALSPDGSVLFVVNTPDGYLELLDVDEDGLRRRASVPVGLEPVAVAVRTAAEVWVVNHLSDSVSVVDVATEPPRVKRTLLVGDEPRDIVFAGAGRRRAFVTTAHRGQHRSHASLVGVPGSGDPRLTTPGVGRADVWVFDTGDLGPGLGGTPLRILELFGDTPRALAVSPDGGTVYVGVFFSGSRTTTIPEQAVCDGFDADESDDACPEELPGLPGGNPGPSTNHEGIPAPEVGLIVRFDPDSGEWRDELGRDWSAAVRFELPDLDLFAVDADSLEQTAAFTGVGTVLFALAVHPATGAVYVANTEARNEVRFEGNGDFAGSTLQGHLHEARVTVIAEGEVRPRHLNRHLDYSRRPAPAEDRQHSLATPVALAISGDGARLFVAALGSERIGVLSTAEVEAGTFDPRSASAAYLEVEGGPAGLLLDEARGHLYTLTRFDNAVVAIDLTSGDELQRVRLHNPEPAAIVDGRPLLYDARATSSNGEASCASCHVFGDLDGLAWDLGDPEASVTASPIPILRRTEALAFEPPINGSGRPSDFHPMKGPMVTQTLRGIGISGALHWRGDRSNGIFGVAAGDESLSFRNFAVAFKGLLGREEALSEDEAGRLAAFALQLVLPPNPVRRLDNSLGPDEDAGQVLFATRLLAGDIGRRRCQQCHALDAFRGHFGTRGEQSFAHVSQIFKVPHLRNLYQKVGMFGTPPIDFIRGGNDSPTGDQVRGFGFLHDGSLDTLFRFLLSKNFHDDPSGANGFRSDEERQQVERFLLAFPSDLAPIVGQQITVGIAAAAAAVEERVALLLARAAAPFESRILGGLVTECNVVAKLAADGELRGAVYEPAARWFVTDRADEPRLTLEDLLALAEGPSASVTLTCVPPGSGRRMGIDRDLDGFLDGDERDAGSDPADPAVLPLGG